jgi:hypothetical protein
MPMRTFLLSLVLRSGVECTLRSYESAISHGFFVMYYGPEFLSFSTRVWAQGRGLEVDCIEPGKPVQNCFVESFKGTFRDECLNENLFTASEMLSGRSGPGGRATTRVDLTAKVHARLW